MNPSLIEKAKSIQLMIFDVDGILTNGGITYTESGEEIKTFHVRDGFGIQMLQESGILTAIITGRASPIVKRRAEELNIPYVYQNQADKQQAFEALKAELGLSDKNMGYMGDDFIDIPLLKRAGIGITVPEAPSRVLEAADWITQLSGGLGAVREVCESLLQAQGKWEPLCQKYKI